MSENEINISVVIPVYNGSKTIEELTSRLSAVFRKMGLAYEIILVDDASPDRSWQTIEEVSKKNSYVKGLRLMMNSGQANATTAGMCEARGQWVLTMDDDLQHPPEEIPKLWKAIEEDSELDAVIGLPDIKRHASWRNLASDMVNWLNNVLLSRPSSFKLSSFILMRGDIVQSILRLRTPTPVPGSALVTLTNHIINVPFKHAERTEGQSGYTISKMFRLVIARFLGLSTLPLRVIASLGLFGLLLSLLFGTFLIWKYATGQIIIQGWTTLALLSSISTGFSFLAFGIIGEYLQQILLTVRQVQPYLIRSRTPSNHYSTVESKE